MNVRPSALHTKRLGCPFPISTVYTISAVFSTGTFEATGGPAHLGSCTGPREHVRRLGQE
jgi:hypothetical protein